MVSLKHKILAFLRGPQGRRLLARAQREAAKPANQRRIQQLRGRLLRRR
jgi:hypothetical protein